MHAYRAPMDDIVWLLTHVLDAPQQLAHLSAHAEFDAALMREVLEQAGVFVNDVIAPLSASGDAVGARWQAGQVTMPPGFRDAYQAFWQAGWPALACDPEDGGQGLPLVLEAVLYETLSAANHGWTMAPGLLHGAYACLKHHAAPAQRALYLPKLASGEWLATMCLTEPQAGSDLGLVRTRATPQADGSVHLNGTKIFISGGEHDLCDNIVHLVLARLPDAPPGPKGLSLFVTAKFLPDGRRCPVVCERIEEKMGIHASPTCVLRFDDAPAWPVGEPGRGLNAMFVMMNAARLHVGLQGIGLLDAAWQKAAAYACERRQMRAPGSHAAPGQADALLAHPAMQRVLLTQRAWIDAGRVVAYSTALALDVAEHASDPAQRAQAQRWCSLITPVLKAAWTAQAFEGASACLQVFGGHGYVREWGIEQIVRDARIAMIYEGTNEIQAIDLLVRKVLPDAGQGLRALLQDLELDTPVAQAIQPHLAPNAACAPERAHPAQTLAALCDQLLPACAQRPALAYWLADDFLRALALVLVDWAWRRIAQAPDAATLARWSDPAQAVSAWLHPEFDRCVATVRAQLGRDCPSFAMLRAEP